MVKVGTGDAALEPWLVSDSEYPGAGGIAIVHFGHPALVEVAPDPGDADLLARITVCRRRSDSGRDLIAEWLRESRSGGTKESESSLRNKEDPPATKT